MSRILTAALALVAGLSASSAMAQSYTAPAGIPAEAASVAPATIVVPGRYDGLVTGSVVRSHGRAVRR